MKWTAEADLVVGLAFGSGRRKVGVGFGIGRRKIIKNIGIDLGEHQLKRCGVFFLKNSTVLSLNWSLNTRNSIYLHRDKAMKRTNVFNLLLQMMPSSHHPVVPSSPDHWAFLDEVDAPRWADLAKEAALMGTLGDDPWFHRFHLHHETSLARAENFSVSDSNGSSLEIPLREPQPTTRRGGDKGGGKGTVSKLIKPALKANVVKACLGRGMQRVSNERSNARGRLSSRPRLSTSLSKSKPVKKVNIIHRSAGILLQQQKKAGSDPRAAQSEPSSAVGTPKKSSLAKPNGNILRRSEPILTNVREAAAQKILGRRGGATDRRNDSRSVGGESDDASLRGSESPGSMPLYRLPASVEQGVGDVSHADSVVVKSPSDMYLSSDASPRHSVSSQESPARALSASAASTARRKILAEGRRSNKGSSNESLEIPSDSTQSGEISRVRVDEPHLEITSFNAEDVAVDTTSSTTGALDWNDQQQPDMIAVKRSLGPPTRVKVTEKAGSSAKKKSNARNENNQDGAAAPSEKSSASQATHPILEKLRKSWGSALRVKQRHDAETSLSDGRSDTSAENSAEFKVGSNVTTRKKWDHTQVQSEVMKRAQQQAGAATTNQPPSEREAMIRNIVTRERRAAIAQKQQQLLQEHPPQQLQLITDAGVLVSPTRPECHNASDNLRRAETYASTTESQINSAATAPNAAKVGLAKIQANYQRSKSDLPSKFKKQYVHADTGMSKSLSMQRGNKENVQLEVKVPSPPSGLAWKRKPAVPTRRQLSPRNLGTALNSSRSVPPLAAARSSSTAHHARTRASSTQTSPPAKNLVNSGRSSLLYTSTSKTVSLDAAYISGSKSEMLDTKANNLAILRGSSTSSVHKLTKQKSDKISSTSMKAAITNTADAKAYKTGVKVADEPVVIAAEDRKSKPAPKYEPRIHGVRAIKEWESKSGKRYYDLSPIERQKVNQEISAAAATSSKTVETKRTSA